MSLRYQLLRGAAIRTELHALAALRLGVFREWPYLYDGTLDDERRYLETYVACAESLVVLVWDGEECIAATTALPLDQAAAEMRAPFQHAGIATANVLYFGESLVQRPYRGQGIGLRFFAEREAHARALGLARCAFCAVERPSAHPLKPADYVPNDAFWQRRGYAHRSDLRCGFEWRDLDQTAASTHTLSYWLKTL